MTMNMKRLADLIGVSTPIFYKGGDAAVRKAEELRDQAEEQHRLIEAISARVDTVASSLRAIQDDIAELLQ